MFKQQLKRALKPIYYSAKRKYVDSIYRYGPQDLTNALEAFGIGPNDNLMIHSGFNQFSGFSGSPEDVVKVLLDLVAPRGNLLMMSMPYGGSSQRYAESGSTFDIAKSPSALGLISESFRRRSEVKRSANPLHPVLASGPLADWLTADHEHIAYSCGRRSPFARFLKIDGKFLFFDAVFRSLTFVHYVEDLYRNQLPVALYDDAPTPLAVKLLNGKTINTRQFLFSAAARERRNFEAIESAMRASKRLLNAKLGNTELLYCRAQDVADTSAELMTSGQGFYH